MKYRTMQQYKNKWLTVFVLFSEISCSEKLFQCANKQCIPTTFVCDGEADCQDGSDENPVECPSKYRKFDRAQHNIHPPPRSHF